MFQRSQQEEYQRMQDTRIRTMRQILEPLRKHWPELVIQLTKNIESDYGPTSLGEALAEEFYIMLETLEKEKQKRIDEVSRTRWDRERELGNKID